MSAERHKPNPDGPDQSTDGPIFRTGISVSEDGKSITLDPGNLSLGSIVCILEHQIFTTTRVRIEFQYPEFKDEITSKQLKDQLLHASEEDRQMFIQDKAEELSYADSITIYHLEE